MAAARHAARQARRRRAASHAPQIVRRIGAHASISLLLARRTLRHRRSAARARVLTWQTGLPATTPPSVLRAYSLLAARVRSLRVAPRQQRRVFGRRRRRRQQVQPPAITVSAAAQPPAGACRCASCSACAALHATASAQRRAFTGLGGAAISVSRSSLTLNTLRRQGTPGARPPPPPVVSYR